MDLPTYTNIWRIEKRLYKLYDFRLPQPLPVVTLGVFLGVCAVWFALMSLIRVPFDTPWHVLWLVPPGIITFFATRPVIEGKRLTELLLSQGRYLTEARVYTRLTPEYEPAEVRVAVRVWHRDPAAAPLPAARKSARRSSERERPRKRAPQPRGRAAGQVPKKAMPAAPEPRRAPAARTAREPAPLWGGPALGDRGDRVRDPGREERRDREIHEDRTIREEAVPAAPAEVAVSAEAGQAESAHKAGQAENAEPAGPEWFLGASQDAVEDTATPAPVDGFAPAAAPEPEPAFETAVHRADAPEPRTEQVPDTAPPPAPLSGSPREERREHTAQPERGTSGPERSTPARRGLGMRVLNYFGFALPKEKQEEKKRSAGRQATPPSGLSAANRTELGSMREQSDAPDPRRSPDRLRGPKPAPGAARPPQPSEPTGQARWPLPSTDGQDGTEPVPATADPVACRRRAEEMMAAPPPAADADGAVCAADNGAAAAPAEPAEPAGAAVPEQAGGPSPGHPSADAAADSGAAESAPARTALPGRGPRRRIRARAEGVGITRRLERERAAPAEAGDSGAGSAAPAPAKPTERERERARAPEPLQQARGFGAPAAAAPAGTATGTDREQRPQQPRRRPHAAPWDLPVPLAGQDTGSGSESGSESASDSQSSEPTIATGEATTEHDARPAPAEAQTTPDPAAPGASAEPGGGRKPPLQLDHGTGEHESMFHVARAFPDPMAAGAEAAGTAGTAEPARSASARRAPRDAADADQGAPAAPQSAATEAAPPAAESTGAKDRDTEGRDTGGRARRGASAAPAPERRPSPREDAAAPEPAGAQSGRPQRSPAAESRDERRVEDRRQDRRAQDGRVQDGRVQRPAPKQPKQPEQPEQGAEAKGRSDGDTRDTREPANAAQAERMEVLDRHLNRTDTPPPPQPRFDEAKDAAPRRPVAWFTDAEPEQPDQRPRPGRPTFSAADRNSGTEEAGRRSTPSAKPAKPVQPADRSGAGAAPATPAAEPAPAPARADRADRADQARKEPRKELRGGADRAGRSSAEPGRGPGAEPAALDGAQPNAASGTATPSKPPLELDHGTGEHESFGEVGSAQRRATAADLEAAEAAAIRARRRQPEPAASAGPTGSPRPEAAGKAPATGSASPGNTTKSAPEPAAAPPPTAAGQPGHKKSGHEKSGRLSRAMRATPGGRPSPAAPAQARPEATATPGRPKQPKQSERSERSGQPQRSEKPQQTQRPGQRPAPQAGAAAQQPAPRTGQAQQDDDGVFARVAQNARRISHLFGQTPPGTAPEPPADTSADTRSAAKADQPTQTAGPGGGGRGTDKPALQLDHGTGEQQRLTDTPNGTPAPRAVAPAHKNTTPGSGGTRGWRRLARVVTGGSAAAKPDGLSSGDVERLRTALGGTRRVVVLGCTGGAGQTITTLMLGHTLAAYRDERVVAVDVNPGADGLSRRIRTQTPETLTSLLANADSVHGYPGMRRYTSQTGSGLEVVSTLDDPYVQTLDDRDYAGLTGLLEAHYEVVLLDPAATGVARALPIVDGLVLVVPASGDAARSVAMTFEWLDGHGYADLRAKAVVAINGVSKRSLGDVDAAEQVARGRCRAIARVPWDDHLSAGTVVDVGTLRATTRRAHAALGGVLMRSLAEPAPISGGPPSQHTPRGHSSRDQRGENTQHTTREGTR